MKHILQMSFIATSGMTLFSYILAQTFKEKFLETKLLNQLVFPYKKETNKNHPAGFLIHYAMGTFFSAIYYTIWKNSELRPSVATSSAMGFLTGIPGIAGWHTFLTLHSNPPTVHFRKYYLQLLFAHVIFGLLNGHVFKNTLQHND